MPWRRSWPCHRPTAVLVDNNLGGVGLIRGLMDANLRVGQDISVVVHGDIPQDTLLTGLNVTTVTQPDAANHRFCAGRDGDEGAARPRGRPLPAATPAGIAGGDEQRPGSLKPGRGR